MADYELSFTQPDESPWAEPGWTILSGTFQINSNGLRPNTVDADGYAVYYDAADGEDATVFTGDTARVAFTVITNASSSNDPLGCCILDVTSKAGYTLRSNGVNLQIYRRDTGSGLGSGVGANVVVTAANGTEYALEYTKSTGLLEVFEDGVSIFTRTDTTYEDSTLIGGLYGSFQDSQSRRIGEVGITGLIANPVITDYPAIIRSGSADNEYATSLLGDVSGITIGTLAAIDIDDTDGVGFHGMPALTDETVHELYGTRTVTITGENGAPTTTTNFLPPDGMDYVVLGDDINDTETGAVFEFDPPAAEFDQIVKPVELGIDESGNILGDTGVYVCWHLQFATKIARSYLIILGDLPGNTGYGIKSKRITTQKITTQKIGWSTF